MLWVVNAAPDSAVDMTNANRHLTNCWLRWMDSVVTKVLLLLRQLTALIYLILHYFVQDVLTVKLRLTALT
ncbi:hypothetical protein D3C71_1384550 [compost metagenome]